jgi:signal transduction histidine kinase
MNSVQILIVDDDHRGRKLLASYLKPRGYDVLMASSGEEALEIAAESMPAVMLLDVMMPGMTGLEVCRIIKENPETRLTQIMMVTALGGEDDVVEGLDTGADDYIAKPVPKAEFLAKVRALVRARTLMADLSQARAELEKRNRELELKKTLAQTLVHDLKSPLTTVVGNLDLMRRKEGFQEDVALNRARNGANRMSQMIMDLLDVECLEDGGLTPVLQENDIKSMLLEAVDANQARSDQQGVRLRAGVCDDHCSVEADKALMRRVLDNLISNALAYSSDGMEVAVEVARCPEGIKLTVTDQGPGVPAEQRQAIFEKYSRLDQSGVAVRKNRGLGLTFCQMAVEAHGGTIWVDDAPAGGAMFQVLLPELEAPELIAAEEDNFILFPRSAAVA